MKLSYKLWVTLVLGLFIIITSIVYRHNEYLLEVCTDISDATILNIEEEKEFDDDGGIEITYIHTIGYSYNNEYYTNSTDNYNRLGHTGDSIEIKVNPNKPEEWIVESKIKQGNIFFSIIVIIMAIVLVVIWIKDLITIVVLILWRKRQ